MREKDKGNKGGGLWGWVCGGWYTLTFNKKINIKSNSPESENNPEFTGKDLDTILFSGIGKDLKNNPIGKWRYEYAGNGDFKFFSPNGKYAIYLSLYDLYSGTEDLQEFRIVANDGQTVATYFESQIENNFRLEKILTIFINNAKNKIREMNSKKARSLKRKAEELFT